MILVEKEDEWMKEVINIEEVKQILRINCSYAWNFQIYLYTPKNASKLDEWGKFKTLPKKYAKELIIKKMHGGIEVWCIQHRSITIDVT
jgi:hypothetical protein